LKREDIESYLRTRTGMLMVAYGKKENSVFVDVCVKHLSGFPYIALKKGFDKAEISFERFPTVKKISEICGEFIPSQSWRYNFQPGKDPDGTPCLIDPDPDCDSCRKPFSEHPHSTCQVVVDKLHAKYMYKPQDCPEGLAFLALMKKISEEGRKKRFIFPAKA
jgi:hypothetical protein